MSKRERLPFNEKRSFFLMMLWGPPVLLWRMLKSWGAS